MNFVRNQGTAPLAIEKVLEEHLRELFNSESCIRDSTELNEDIQPQTAYVSGKHGDEAPYTDRYVFVSYGFRAKNIKLLLDSGILFINWYCRQVPEKTLVLIRRNITVEFDPEKEVFSFSCRLAQIPADKSREVVKVYKQRDWKITQKY